MTPYWTTFLHLDDLSGLERHYGRIGDSLIVKLWSNVILVMLTVTIELSIVRKKNRVLPNVTKVW